MAEQRTQLSRELITRTALDVVARDGLEALSMRRLAQELDVWPMSVYRHFRDKEDLLDAVAAAGVEGVGVPAARGGWQRRLETLAEAAHAALSRQPAALRGRTLLSPGMLRLTEAALGVLTGAGLTARAAATAWASVLAHALGTVELGAATGSEARTRTALLDASEGEHPELAAVTVDLSVALAGPDAFADGLRVLIAGIAQQAR